MESIMTDESVKLAIDQLPGERVTKEAITKRIVSIEYDGLASAPTLTLCSIVLDNGYSVRGESACVDPANFNSQIGEKLAFEDAFRKLWPLFGFLLAEKRHIYHGAWVDAPQWQKDSAIAGVTMHVNRPDAGPEQSHDSWMAQKVADGWKWGPVKDAEKKEHPCMVPFNELPTLQQAKDYLFRAVVHAGLCARSSV